MSRITLEDTVLSSITKLSEGNPGAAIALAAVFSAHETVDPNASGPGGAVIKFLYLDDWGIYGPNIHVLFKDVCQCNPAKFIALLRGVQLDLIKQEQLVHASIRPNKPDFDPDIVWQRVCNRLPKFQKPEEKS